MKVKSDPCISTWRKILFPFFDTVEIWFVLSLELLVIIAVVFTNPVNGWAIYVGSWLGMLAVGQITLPSILQVDVHSLSLIKNRIENGGYARISESIYIPMIPAYLRWPRTKIEIFDASDTAIIKGPKILLDHLLILLP